MSLQIVVILYTAISASAPAKKIGAAALLAVLTTLTFLEVRPTLSLHPPARPAIPSAFLMLLSSSPDPRHAVQAYLRRLLRDPITRLLDRRGARATPGEPHLQD